MDHQRLFKRMGDLKPIMKKLLPLVLSILLISCKDNLKITTDKTKGENPTTTENSVLSFDGFKTALNKDDAAQIKEYIRFPLKTETYISWKYAKEMKGEDGDESSIYLDEADYEKNKDLIFPHAFIEILKSISIDDVIKKKNIISPVFTDEDGDDFQIEFIYDNEFNELFLQFTQKNPIQVRDEDNKSEAEYNSEELEIYQNKDFDDIRYFFSIDKNKNIKLTKVDAYK